jgi:putative transcription factor
MSARKLDEATEAVHIARVDKELSKAIAQARTALKLSQKDLATAINSKPQVIAEYENGKAIPDGKIIAALERKLQTKLPRPGKTKLPPKDPVAAAKAAQVKAATNGGLTRGGPPKRR